MTRVSQPASRVTIEDIARKAGVHRSTVSRALRGDVRITPETRDRIQRIAEDLQYEPNFLAKGLAGQGTRTVGILAPYLRDGFYVAIVSRQQDLLLEQGYSALMGMTKGGYGPTERQAIANLVSRGVDGLILNHVPGDPETNEVLMGLAAEGLPIGMLGTHHLKGIDCVGYDTSLMAAQIVHHLVELGHRRIGIISWSTHSRRVVGYRQGLRDHRLTYRPDYVYIADASRTGMAALTGRILAHPAPPTAILTVDDDMAAQLLVELESHGRRVPGDISVTGFDDSWFSPLCRVPLTTMRLPQAEMAAALVDLVMARTRIAPADRSRHARRVDFTGELVVRQSTAPPPSAE